jgi:hypothetical protein
LSPPGNLSDSAARDLIRRLNEEGNASSDLPPYPVDPTAVIRSLTRETPGHGVAAAFKTVQRKLHPDTVHLLQTLSEHPRTTLLRQIARAPRVDILGSALDRPLSAYGTLDRAPQPAYGAFRTAAEANALGALLATSRGDKDTAALRLGENLGLAEHFLRTPSLFANRYGVGMLQQLALLPLAEIERSRESLVQAQWLAEAGDQIRDEVFSHAWPGRLAGLAADAADLSPFSAALRGSRLSPGYRIESFYGGWAGFCLNRWEILGGLSPARERAVLTIADAMTEVPHAGELARLTAAMWSRQAQAKLGNPIGRLLWCWRAEG